MRVLGIDPGLTRCGFGVVESGSSGKAVLHDVGVIKTPSEMAIEERLWTIHSTLDELIHKYSPTAMAVERVFAQANVSTVMGTAQVSGAVLILARGRDIPIRMYTPTEVKASVTGSGRADKAQVGLMVSRILGLSEPPKPADAADALAIAICHLWRGVAQDRLAAAVAAQRSKK